MASTYAELQSELASWLNKSNLTSVIPTFIAFAESEFNRRLRLRDMLVSASVTVSSNPTDLSSELTRFRAMKACSINYSGVDRVLNYISPDIFLGRYADTSSGIPEYYSLVGDNFYTDPAPDGSYTATMIYYQGIVNLDADTNTTNWLLTKHPDLYLSCAQKYGAIYLKDAEAVNGFTAMTEHLLGEVRKEDIRSRTGGTSRMISETRAV